MFQHPAKLQQLPNRDLQPEWPPCISQMCPNNVVRVTMAVSMSAQFDEDLIRQNEYVDELASIGNVPSLCQHASTSNSIRREINPYFDVQTRLQKDLMVHALQVIMLDHPLFALQRGPYFGFHIQIVLHVRAKERHSCGPIVDACGMVHVSHLHETVIKS